MWDMLKEAFGQPEGFTVLFYLRSGTVLNLSMSEPNWKDFFEFKRQFIHGTNIETDQPVTILIANIDAYEIAY